MFVILSGCGGPDTSNIIVRKENQELRAKLVVPGHPEVCRLSESLLTELVGVPVQEQCDRNESSPTLGTTFLEANPRQRWSFFLFNFDTCIGYYRHHTIPAPEPADFKSSILSCC